MKEFGFENKEDTKWGCETTLYSNGLVQLWYDAESFVYDKVFNITTMNEVGYGDKHPNIEI